jgi:hypothetical protein
MSSSAERVRIQPALASAVHVSPDRLSVALTDGREISVPLDRYPRLAAATPPQRENWEITAFGTAIRWPDIDEDIGVAGLLGVPESPVEEAAGFEIHDIR